MRRLDTLLGITSLALGLLGWWFPNIELKLKIIISGLALLAILLIFFKDKLQRVSFFFRKNWQLTLSGVLLIAFVLLFKTAFKDLLFPALLIILISISISILIAFRYGQSIPYKSKRLIRSVAFTENWRLNHWGSNCARIEGNRMIFSGLTAPNGTDGSHIDYTNLLEIGASYEITCFAKSQKNTKGQFQLWCHDKTGEINGISVSTDYKTPSTKGNLVSINFPAKFNQNIRIHLQYNPGEGEIEISDVTIYKLST